MATCNGTGRRLCVRHGLSNAKREWLRSHPEFLARRAELVAAHDTAQQVGLHDDSDEYFRHMTNALAADGHERPFHADPLPDNTPPPIARIEPPAARRVASGPVVSAPVNRESISFETGQPVMTKVTLTPQQREIAVLAMPHLPREQAEQLYAQNLLKMEKMKRAGLIQDR